MEADLFQRKLSVLFQGPMKFNRDLFDAEDSSDDNLDIDRGRAVFPTAGCMIDCFYVALFSASEQTHCVLVACN